MNNKSESEEKRYLSEILSKLREAYQAIDRRISSYASEIQETKKYIWENNAQLDLAEKAANRIAVHEMIGFGEKAVAQKRKIAKLINSPYFGRIDFLEKDGIREIAFYIGIHSFHDENGDVLIYDWRAPVSSMFYDFEIGNAFYAAPMGRVCGRICLKRQYRIRNSSMEYMLESALNIGDEVLQKELSRTSDEKMKNIVATIQREQNDIIRNEKSSVLIIQGVAGSGKTSIALHRVAFLLYRFKGNLTSKDILIISPNKVFADYISNVLPELGEEEIIEMGLEEIAANELPGQLKFQTFNQQVAELIDSVDVCAVQRIEYKATLDFVKEIEAFLANADLKYFSPSDICIDKIKVSREQVMLSYLKHKRLPVKKRIQQVAQDIIARIKAENGARLKPSVAPKIKTEVLKMYKFQDVLSLYKYFYQHIKKPELLHLAKNNTLEYADVFPLAYMKISYDGIEKDFSHIKHLLVDEMQDYTPIQYAVMKKLFHCKMTILGDSCQSVNPYSSSNLEVIKNLFDGADCVELCKSYRSTIEITNFAQKIKSNSKLIPVERHGEEPTVKNCLTADDQYKEIRKLINQFLHSEFNSLGIVCKTQGQADEMYEQIKKMNENVHLLDFESTTHEDGIIVTSAHMAKGLEFDQVIIPSVSAAMYHTDLDKSLLYVGCTRAMHKLDLTCFGEVSPFLC